MKLNHPAIRGLLLVLVVGAMLWAEGVRPVAAAEPAAAAPAHRVIACYFHRTQRCPTCRKIGAYIEEAVQTGFPQEIRQGQVSVYLVDFQNPKNRKYSESYNITGPTLVLIDVHDGKVAAWRPAPKVWSLVGDKAAFFQYVQQGIRDYMETR
jgi:hypothetical protein